MSSGPIRRGQLIAPFGVGAMVIDRGGTSMITAGLDHWYEYEDGHSHVIPDEFVVHEWRLEGLLRKNHFRIPPDYRTYRQGQKEMNLGITVPFLRFPQYHYCNTCHLLHEAPLSHRGRMQCSDCRSRGKSRTMFQVPVVAICDHGHMQDFPWREWVHRTASPTCREPIRLVWTGSTSLAGQRVKCDCGQERPLRQVMSASPDGNKTELSQSLAHDGTLFLCQGRRPWLGTAESSPCARPIRAALRSASNVYFAVVKNSVYLPRRSKRSPSKLVSLLERPPVSVLVSLLVSMTEDTGRRDLGVLSQAISTQYPHILSEYSTEQVTDALRILVQGESGDEVWQGTAVQEDDPETGFRRAEFHVLRQKMSEAELRIRETDMNDYAQPMNKFFSRITLVDKLRETRALVGFTRVFPENGQEHCELSSMLWRKEPAYNQSWLPACVVFGEGIFIEFDETHLKNWQERAEKRICNLVERYGRAKRERHLRERAITPRFVLIHTFAHILMNRLVFECGYSSASLRERIYVSDHERQPMAALLIYTSAGDSEGTMGGLVRMGRPGIIESVVRRAIEGSAWCSADPVCMEIGGRSGQGPDSCNLAACHSCALVPETACEEFNRFLDRGLLVGTPEDRQLGYFDRLLDQ